MATASSTERYASVQILLHWLMLALLVAVYLTAELQEHGEESPLATWHFAFGLTVFALVWLRLLARRVWPAPEPIEGGWRHVLSRITHGILYVLMIGMPLVGWLLVSAEGAEVSFLGFTLPHLIPAQDHDTAELFEEVHEAGAAIGYWVVGLHAVAALFHQYVLRDGLLARMLPHATKG